MYAEPFIHVFKDDLYFDMSKKYLKKTYRGKITKTYGRLLLRKRKSEKINLSILRDWLKKNILDYLKCTCKRVHFSFVF